MDGNNQVSVFLVGKTNDCNFSTIQEALDNVEENSVIQVKPGIYNEHLSFTKKVHLIGCKESIKDKSSTELPIVVLDSDKSCEIDVPVKIEGIVFTHKKDLQFDSILSFIKTSLNFEDKEQEEFRSLLLINSESDFNNIAILCSEENGITFSGIKSSFTNSFIHHTAVAGIYVTRDAKPTINNCMITDSNSVGIRIDDSASPKIEYCKIEKSAGMGVCASGNANPTIICCTINDCAFGICIIESSIGTYKNCDIHHNKIGFNIDIDNQISPQISKNIIHNNEAIGIVTKANSNARINDCEIFANGIGVMIDESSTLEIIRCEIYKNNDNGIISISNVMMQYCEIYDQPLGIILQGSSNGFFGRCLIHDCKDICVLIDSHTTTVIEDCVICKSGIGIYLKKGKLEISGSDIYQNTDFGINIATDRMGSYEYCNIHDNGTGIFGTSSQKPNFDTCNVCNNSKGNISFLQDMFK